MDEGAPSRRGPPCVKDISDLKKQAIKYGRILIGIGISVGLCWFLARGLDWSDVWDNITSASIPLLIVGFLVFMGASVLRAARWQMLFIDPQPSIPRLFIVQHEGLGLGNVMPIRVASEVTQVGVLTMRDKIRLSTVLAAIGMERIVDMLSSMLLIGVGVIFVSELRTFAPLVWSVVIGIAAGMAALQILSSRGRTLSLVRRVRFLAAFSDSLNDLFNERRRLVKAFAASLAYWMLVGLSAWVIARAVRLDDVSPIAATLVILVTISFSTIVPAAPSAIGTFHAAVVYGLGLIDVPEEAAFPFAFIVHLFFFVPAIVIAAIFLPREKISLRRPWTPKSSSTSDAPGGEDEPLAVKSRYEASSTGETPV